MRLNFILLILIWCMACSEDSNEKSDIQPFKRILPETSGLDFSNILDEENLKNPFNYVNVYLGGGVSIGDINNDGLQDVYLTANMSSSKLFLNKGNLQFEDITLKSGTSTTGWSSSTTMADVNNDGWLDIYVCKSYHDKPEDRANILFLNNQDGTFTNVAGSLGIDDTNFSVASSFFDYDKDGDLDLIVGNHPRYRAVPLSVHYNYWKNPELKFSNRLYRNDGERFTEVTKEAGILSYGFTLAVSTSDITNDGYPDIFISVDHDEPDYIFENNKDGTFTNILDSAIRQSTLSSMGVDAGDINHDRFPDLFVAEMLSEDHYREKVNMSMQSVDRFNYMVDTMKYKYYQMHNFMYLNNGNKTFSDISQLAGVSKSDWSWATLFMDFDNDGWQDLYCTNGFYREVFNKDRRKVLDSIMHSLNNDMSKMNAAAQEYTLSSKQTKIANYLFRNKGNLQFEKYTEQANLAEKTISTGAAYGDLDNDGDLDLIINNIGEESFLYENQASDNNYIVFGFDSPSSINPLGTKVFIYYKDEVQSRELLTTRGFQSSCENRVHFGLGDVDIVDKVEIIWPDDKLQLITNPEINSYHIIDYKDATGIYSYEDLQARPFKVIDPSTFGIDYVQQENYFNDYNIQVLLPHKMSEYGPFISIADVNGDNKDDIFIGSPQDQASVLYIQNENNTFTPSNKALFESHKSFEDGQSTFFDADGDGDKDLLVASTGYEIPENNIIYQPRLYINDGQGRFDYDKNRLPQHTYSSSCVKGADYDNDGDLDFYIGGRLLPQRYPLAGTSGLFMNNGQGTFENVTARIAPDMERFGMVKDALWTDINMDNTLDLIIVGEWTPISFWIQEDGQFVNRTNEYFDEPITGWWNTVKKHDLDQNGLDDYIFGNLGLNYKYKATKEKPFMVYSSDFDNSGSNDIVLGTYYGDIVYPVRGKSCSSEQIPDLKKKIGTYEEFALSTIQDVYGKKLDEALKYEVNDFASLILFQTEQGKFEVKHLPMSAQISPINDVIVRDVNNDNMDDLIVAGNLYQSEIETGRADSGTGYVLINKGNREFESMSVHESGLYLPNDVKSMQELVIGDKKYILVGNNKTACQMVAY